MTPDQVPTALDKKRWYIFAMCPVCLSEVFKRHPFVEEIIKQLEALDAEKDKIKSRSEEWKSSDR